MSGTGLRADARACFDAAVTAVDPERLVRQRLSRDGAALRLVASGGDRSHRGPVVLVAAGKAALAMARGALAAAAPVSGAIVVPHGAVGPGPGGLDVLGGAHPVPDLGSVTATARVLAAIAAVTPQTLILVLLSGGASALLVAPAGDLTLADKQAVTAAMLASGADVSALHTVRKHCSRVKGGGLVRSAAHAAGVWTLLLSDVVGDDPAVIASGPTVADPTTFSDALRALDRWVDPAVVPRRVRAHLVAGCQGRAAETVKPGDPVLLHALTEVLAGNRTAVVAAAAAASAGGYLP